MSGDTSHPLAELQKTPAWRWKVGFVVSSDELADELTSALKEMNATSEFRISPALPPFEVASQVQRTKPDVLFVELSSVPVGANEWIGIIRSGSDMPLIVAVHPSADPVEMISALRAGAAEFISLPVRPAVFEAMDRIAIQMESKQTTQAAPGRVLGILSAKGGCGATTLACHLAVAIQAASGEGRVLMTDLDHQTPAAHRVYRSSAETGISEAFEAVRRLNVGCWNEFVKPVTPRVDMLCATPGSGSPEPWRIESLFRFVKRHYAWILADLGRHLNPSNWTFLASVDELLVVTAPDVLALYQTRAVLQMLTNRGFDKSRVRLILNRNQNSPQDFWIESIEQMFDMSVLAVLPHDTSTLNRLPKEDFEFPANSAYGRAVSKLAAKILREGPETTKKRAA